MPWWAAVVPRSRGVALLCVWRSCGVWVLKCAPCRGVLHGLSACTSCRVQCLNKQRGVQQNIGPAFDRLAAIMMSCLDACLKHGDVDACKMLMVMVRRHQSYLSDCHARC